MPERYEAIRDAMKAQGKSTKAAKTSAAKIYNATRKTGEAPVTGKYESKSTKNTIVTDASKGKKRKIPPKTVAVKQAKRTPEDMKSYADYLRKLDRQTAR